MSLSDKLASLADLAPVLQDPEDDPNIEASAKLTDYIDDEYVETDSKSILRLRNTALLDDDNERYAGKTVSRAKLQVDFSFNEYGGEVSSFKPAKAEVVKSDEDSDEDDFDDDDDDDLQEFQNQMRNIPTKSKKLERNVDVPSSDSEAESDSDEGVGEDLSENDEEDDAEQSDESGSDAETIQTFSKVNIDDDAEKGSSIKAQLKVWDGVLECRIRMHKSVVAANQLPQHDVWSAFVEAGGSRFVDTAKQCQRSTKHLLDSLVELQTFLLEQNPETSQVVKNVNVVGNVKTPKPSDSDEEITSDSDQDTEKMDTPVESVAEPVRNKRKRTMAEYPEFIKKRHSDFESYRNNAIQTWNDRTKVTTGKVKKSFDNFEHSAVRRIEQILFDRTRLIERTQLKRDLYKTLGKQAPVKSDKSEEAESDIPKNRALAHDSHLKDYDIEIFDDSDFYHNLLRELIEHKAIDPNSPNMIVRQWLDIQKLRKKMKKTVDVKASKGRKIRYDVHPKLVNFMAPMNVCPIEEESRKELFKSLFGKRCDKVVPVEDIRLFQSSKSNKSLHKC